MQQPQQGLRQRRSKRKTNQTSQTPKTQQPQQQVPSTISLGKRLVAALFLICYVVLIIFINPFTALSFYREYTREPCRGLCVLPSPTNQDTPSCPKADPSKLVLVRIPKTATSSVLKVMERNFDKKSIRRYDLQEVEDLVSSLAIQGVGLDRMGYHDPTKYKERIQHYYKRACQSILHTPYYAQDRTLYEGHLHYFDFVQNAQQLVEVPWFYSFLPQTIMDFYRLEPQSLDSLLQMTFLRNPHDRLKSLYYYDRHDARTMPWRNQLVQTRGNQTLEECLLNATCIQLNELAKFGSLQTQIACGVSKTCQSSQEKMLELAKDHLKQGFFLVGIVERMQESLLLLQHVLPIWMEGIDLNNIPREKSSSHITRRESSLSPNAQAALEELCAVDYELYHYANQLLTERIQNCQL